MQLWTPPLAVVQNYFEAWINQDANAILACFGEDATYQDPNVTLPANQVIDYYTGLWESFSNLQFETLHQSVSADGMVSVQWLMTGIHAGSYQGMPPTGKKVSIQGADFIQVRHGKIDSITAYFDGQVISKQLGLEVITQVKQLGQFQFGTSVFAHTGKTKAPGAISITSIWNKPEHNDIIRQASTETAKDFLMMDGFLGLFLARSGERAITVSAWESAEDIKQINTSSAHSHATQRFWQDVGYAAYTSTWQVSKINPMWVRCDSCMQMNDYYNSDGQCQCGSTLPNPPSYF